jgi:hypothetical protein
MDYFFGSQDSDSQQQRGAKYLAKGWVFTNNLVLRMKAIEQGGDFQMYLPSDPQARQLLASFRRQEPTLWSMALVAEQKFIEANRAYADAEQSGSAIELATCRKRLSGLGDVNDQLMHAIFTHLEAFAGSAFTPEIAIELCK